MPSSSSSTSSIPRYSPAHSTSSAFSANAQPNEDWTKISDLAERRRIQNRIAQRNYRKKLKRRLEDLERRAGSTSASPEPSPREISQPPMEPSDASDQSFSRASQPSRPASEPQWSQQTHDLDGVASGLFQHQYFRQPSPSPPPVSYASFATTQHSKHSPYAQSQAFAPYQVPPGFPQYQGYASSSVSTPSPSPGMPVKHEVYDDDLGASYYPYGASAETAPQPQRPQHAAHSQLQMPHRWQGYNQHTPSLTFSESLASPALSENVTTPPLSETFDPFEELLDTAPELWKPAEHWKPADGPPTPAPEHMLASDRPWASMSW